MVDSSVIRYACARIATINNLRNDSQLLCVQYALIAHPVRGFECVSRVPRLAARIPQPFFVVGLTNASFADNYDSRARHTSLSILS